MRKTTVIGLILVLALALLAACGGDDDGASSSSSSSQPAASSSQKASSSGGMTLEQYAAEHAGGVGAIYVGDLKQLVGPAATVDQGDFDGNVPLSALENHIWVYESDFYKKALDKANLTNPTPLTSEGVSSRFNTPASTGLWDPARYWTLYSHPPLRHGPTGSWNSLSAPSQSWDLLAQTPSA